VFPANSIEAFRLREQVGEAGWDWDIDTIQPDPLRWEELTIGLRLPANERQRLDPDKVKWFRRLEWLAVTFGESIVIGPLVPALPHAVCYHLTPAENVQSIFERGLLSGDEAGQSTTHWPGAGEFIYVTFNEADARTWSHQDRLGRFGHAEWALLAIAEAHTCGPVYRDPASKDGFIVDARRIPPERVTAIATFRGPWTPG
jgi:hypothetical protein